MEERAQQQSASSVARLGSQRYSWAAGLIFVVALLVETAVSATIPLNQNDSAAKIAHGLAAHRHVEIFIACASMIYAVAFLVYLWQLHEALQRREGEGPRLSTIALVGGVLFITLHAVSDVGIMGMLGGKIAAYGGQGAESLSYTLYLTTFALDSVGDVLGSVFAVAAGLVMLRTGAFARWLAWVAIAAGALLFIQGFGLGGVIADFGLVVDLVAFVLLLTFVTSSSVIQLRRSSG